MAARNGAGNPRSRLARLLADSRFPILLSAVGLIAVAAAMAPIAGATGPATPTPTRTVPPTSTHASPTPTNTPLPTTATKTSTPRPTTSTTPQATGTALGTTTTTPTATAAPHRVKVALAPNAPWPATPTPGPPAHNNHQPYAANTSSCAACHRVHTSPGSQALLVKKRQEQTCYVCHDGTGGPNIVAEYAKTYTMPLDTSGLHNEEEAITKNPSSFSGANRHVACTDCHEPHDTATGNHPFPSNYAYGPLQDEWGVAAANGTPWAEPTYTTIANVQFENQLCYKCHSAWAYGNSPPKSPSGGFPETSQGLEFNPANASHMGGEDVGANPFVFPDGTSYASSLINGVTPGSRITCSDCHRSETSTDPAGPHGSNIPFMLAAPWNRQTGQTTSGGTANNLCFACHDYNAYVAGDPVSTAKTTGFSGLVTATPENLHTRHVQIGNANNAPIVCMDCHVAIPHGYNQPHLLGLTADGTPYVDRPAGSGLLGITSLDEAGQWLKGSCSTGPGCHH